MKSAHWPTERSNVHYELQDEQQSLNNCIRFLYMLHPSWTWGAFSFLDTLVLIKNSIMRRNTPNSGAWGEVKGITQKIHTSYGNVANSYDHILLWNKMCSFLRKVFIIVIRHESHRKHQTSHVLRAQHVSEKHMASLNLQAFSTECLQGGNLPSHPLLLNWMTSCAYIYLYVQYKTRLNTECTVHCPVARDCFLTTDNSRRLVLTRLHLVLLGQACEVVPLSICCYWPSKSWVWTDT